MKKPKKEVTNDDLALMVARGLDDIRAELSSMKLELRDEFKKIDSMLGVMDDRLIKIESHYGRRLDNLEDKSMIFANVPLQQPTLMVNKKLLPKNFVWYDNDFSSAEELELIFKLFKLGEVRNIKDVVLKYRIHDHNTSFINPKKTFYLTLKTRIKAIFKYGYIPSINGVLTSIAQIMFISIMPNRLIYPSYMYIRGIKKFDLRNARINIDANIFSKKTFELAQA